MHILYADIAGSVGNPKERHIIMAGVAVYETAIYHVMRELDAVVQRHFPDHNPANIELHGNAITAGRRFWRSVPRETRRQLIADALAVLKGPSRRNLTAFAMIIDKAAVSPEDPVEHAFEQLCSRFDMFLRRRYQKTGSAQRGMLVFDEDKYASSLQVLARDFRHDGTRWGNLRNLAEVPMFVNSKATRLIQLADLIAYAMFRNHERGDRSYITPIIQCFDQQGGVMHGIYHRRLPETECDCAACASRRYFS